MKYSITFAAKDDGSKAINAAQEAKLKVGKKIIHNHVRSTSSPFTVITVGSQYKKDWAAIEKLVKDFSH